ncbi:MAG: hypothetical protein JST86_15455 [Bacteroidetes bacterium]|nr:hypothetical protein [Bacteroidota bacterium]
MLSEKEQRFIARWEKVREAEGTFRFKLLSGLPMALLFSAPVLIFFLVVKVFLPSWYTTATYRETKIVVPDMTAKFMQVSAGDIITVFIAVLVIALFFSYFRMHHRWETNEQQYQELLHMQKK